MSKGINKVRASIIKRKKMRELGSKKVLTKQIISPFPQEEEKHGYFPEFLDSPVESKRSNQPFASFIVKGILSVSLFFGVALLVQTELDVFDKSQSWTNYVMTEEFPFARANQWYQTTFGAPLAFTSTADQGVEVDEARGLPVSGNVTETFQANGTGIMISPTNTTEVSAWQDGVIIFVGNDNKTNKTIVIQHADSSKSTYGLLSASDVHLYQFVAKNQRIGRSNPTEKSKPVYFSIEKDNKYIDPVKVIKVDVLQ